MTARPPPPLPTHPPQVRAAVLTASQCATYDEVKSRLLALTGWADSLGAHLAASMVTGLVTTTATNPVDVVKVGACSAAAASSRD